MFEIPTGCTCLIFLLCAFSNVSCLQTFYMVFYHILLFIFKCVLNVSVCILNSDIWIRISWYSNLVGLFSAVFFSLCVFKWVLTLNTWKDTKSHWLHLLVVFFSTACFQMCPQIACNVTLVAFLWFSPHCVYLMIPQTEHVMRYIVKLFTFLNFSPLCVIKWDLIALGSDHA